MECQITQVTQPPCSSDLARCDLWLFPKLKSPLNGRDFRPDFPGEIQENMTGQLMEIRRTVWGPSVPTLKGTEVSLSYVQCIFFNKCLYFSHCMAGYFLDRPQGCIEGYQICSFSLQIQEKKICYFLHDFCPL